MNIFKFVLPYVVAILGMAAWFTLVIIGKADSTHFIEALQIYVPSLGVGVGVHAIHTSANNSAKAAAAPASTAPVSAPAPATAATPPASGS